MNESPPREWSIQEIARLSGTTSRALRHYGQLGLLEPSRVGANGYRYYDADALARLQRILLLRDLGLGLPAIGQILREHSDTTQALTGHLGWLRQEQDRLDRQIRSVQKTIDTMRTGEGPMAEDMFDGFDHTVYREEVTERWGADAYADGDRWWRQLSADQKRAFQQEQRDIQSDYAAAREAGETPDGDVVQAISARHYEWITLGWQGVRPSAEQFAGLGAMYVADERFAANYGGAKGATFVRDAMAVFAAGLPQ